MNEARKLFMQFLLATVIVGMISLTLTSGSMVPASSSHTLVVLQEDMSIDDTPPEVYFISPSNEETVEYGTIEIEFYVHDDVSISKVSLTAGEWIFNLTGRTSPFEWEPRRDGWFTLTLFCFDNSENFATDTIRVRVAIIRSTSPTIIIPLAIGFIALCSVVYKFRFEKSDEWHEDPDFASTITIPIHYMLRSRIFSRERDWEER